MRLTLAKMADVPGIEAEAPLLRLLRSVESLDKRMESLDKRMGNVEAIAIENRDALRLLNVKVDGHLVDYKLRCVVLCVSEYDELKQLKSNAD